jgi:hypothetical protein
MLVLVERRNALRRHLAAEPVGLFQQHHATAVPGSRKRSGDTSSAAAGDQDLAGLSARALGPSGRRLDRQDGERRIAARRHPHHIDDRIE